MKEKVSTGALWNNGAKYGALLGAVTIICRLLSQAISLLNIAFLSSGLSFVVWVAQFAGCILLMRFFMKKLVADYDDVTNRTTFRYGMILALLSAFLFATFNFAYFTFSTEAVATQMNAVYQIYGENMDSNMRNMITSIEENFPVLMFISTLIYCFLYGLVLSAILSSRIPSKDPFADSQE